MPFHKYNEAVRSLSWAPDYRACKQYLRGIWRKGEFNYECAYMVLLQLLGMSYTDEASMRTRSTRRHIDLLLNSILLGLKVLVIKTLHSLNQSLGSGLKKRRLD